MEIFLHIGIRGFAAVVFFLLAAMTFSSRIKEARKIGCQFLALGFVFSFIIISGVGRYIGFTRPQWDLYHYGLDIVVLFMIFASVRVYLDFRGK